MQVQSKPVVPSDQGFETVDLSVLVPVHNEEDNIVPLVESISAALKDSGKSWELILVDDGSTDGTLARARAQLARPGLQLKVIELQRNYGQAAGLQAAIDAARGRLIATLDGDLQNDPADIPRMIEMLETQDLDMVCGWRKDRQDGLMLRLIPSWIANRLIRKVTGVHIHDYGCGLKVYRAKVLKQVRIMGGMHRFIPAWIASVTPTRRIGEMVVNHHARQFGQSKYGISRTSRVILDLFSVLFFMRFRQRPGHFFGTIGLVLGAISAAMFFYLFVVRFVVGQDIGTRPMLLMAIMLFLGAIQMITTGVVAEMLVRSSGDGDVYLVREVYEVENGNS
ncbi:MAG: glycosyltransferase family 2 protein [Rhizobiaceae bacterium]|nr:glycosyltransferase family 2 protein [Rhizobiaceae bacterium]